MADPEDPSGSDELRKVLAAAGIDEEGEPVEGGEGEARLLRGVQGGAREGRDGGRVVHVQSDDLRVCRKRGAASIEIKA